LNEIVAIINPKSANGRTARAFEDLRPLLPKEIAILHTKSRGHATELTADALRAGAKIIVAVGGDGTIHEVANGFLQGDSPTANESCLAIIPCGTGSDFRRATRIPAEPRAAVELLKTGVRRKIDALRVRHTTTDGKTRVRYAINVVSFGLGGAAVQRSNEMSKALGGRISYAIATTLTAARFSSPLVELRVDDAPFLHSRITQVAAGNGQFHGGGMRICPQALVDDGWIDVTAIGEIALHELARGLPSLYNGSILKHPKASSRRARKLEAFSDETVLVEIDGETAGKLPLEIEIVPAALSLLTV
jgi:YegS/Rv2252/BmrU family lipid kinase